MRYKSMLKYLVPFLAYVLIGVIVSLFTSDIYTAYISKTLLTGALLIYFYKDYKIKWKLDFLAVVLGLLVFMIWILPETIFNNLPSWYSIEISSFNPYLSTFPMLFIITKLIGALLVAPLIEELFTRDFLIRFLIGVDRWEKVKIGAYSLFSFSITVLFFGLSHDRWIVGLITAVIWNLLLYKSKNISSCIQSHLVANFCLAVYVLMTNSWMFW